MLVLVFHRTSYRGASLETASWKIRQMVVISRQGRPGLKQLMLGSNAEVVERLLQRSAVIVKGGCAA